MLKLQKSRHWNSRKRIFCFTMPSYVELFWYSDQLEALVYCSFRCFAYSSRTMLLVIGADYCVPPRQQWCLSWRNVLFIPTALKQRSTFAGKPPISSDSPMNQCLDRRCTLGFDECVTFFGLCPIFIPVLYITYLRRT
ncbi:thioesterase/thiol ester dehydrase-isomerasesuperfamily protein [Striga asiatica]|uniref:Thioesterase/thiol ester dehydrase-isomerasesuperfamily protein n=1 Tax=Striga asiatica TaxID=4170 RepID=A0A5A7PTK6_STRAF|nr:thioesterase/thiol ester dehydrase-isomerasesuperfamily protein [Striga asiatica]